MKITILELPRGSFCAPVRHEVPVLKQFGSWCVHRCLAWHINKSWETGELAPISLKTSPTKHNKVCDEFLEKKILEIKTNWAAKAIKKMSDTQKRERQHRMEETMATFTSCDITYSVSHIDAGLAWPTKYPLLTTTAAYNAAKILQYYLPENLAALFVAKRKTLSTELRNTLKGLLGEAPRPGEVNSEETRNFIRTELERSNK